MATNFLKPPNLAAIKLERITDGWSQSPMGSSQSLLEVPALTTTMLEQTKPIRDTIPLYFDSRTALMINLSNCYDLMRQWTYMEPVIINCFFLNSRWTSQPRNVYPPSSVISKALWLPFGTSVSKTMSWPSAAYPKDRDSLVKRAVPANSSRNWRFLLGSKTDSSETQRTSWTNASGIKARQRLVMWCFVGLLWRYAVTSKIP